MKKEALKLADELDSLHQYVPSEAPAMIRRLVEELNCAEDYIKQYQLQTKPLSDEEIGDCVDDYFGLMALQHKYIYDIDQVQQYGLKLAKAIEERHGIK